MISVVPAGKVLRYGYVEQHRIQFADMGGMYLEAVSKWLDVYQQIGELHAQPADAPFGHWDDWFVIENGRHRRIAALIQGYPWLLVCWLEEA